MARLIAVLSLITMVGLLAPIVSGQTPAQPSGTPAYSPLDPNSKYGDFGNDARLGRRAPAEIVAPATPTASEPLNARTPERPAAPAHRPGPGDWLEAQLFFIVWGLIATMIALVVCPRASLMTAAAIENEPMRCVAVGTVGLLAIGLFNVLNAILFGAALWAPVGVLFFILSMVIFIYSAILGIVFIGSGVARRFGWHGLGFFGRAAAGFAALAILNCLPVAGMASMGLQCVAVLCGLGGLIVTGFGSDPQWLTRILSGNRPK